MSSRFAHALCWASALFAAGSLFGGRAAAEIKVTPMSFGSIEDAIKPGNPVFERVYKDPQGRTIATQLLREPASAGGRPMRVEGAIVYATAPKPGAGYLVVSEPHPKARLGYKAKVYKMDGGAHLGEIDAVRSLVPYADDVATVKLIRSGKPVAMVERRSRVLEDFATRFTTRTIDARCPALAVVRSGLEITSAAWGLEQVEGGRGRHAILRPRPVRQPCSDGACPVPATKVVLDTQPGGHSSAKIPAGNLWSEMAARF